jgi:hypothetical protein
MELEKPSFSLHTRKRAIPFPGPVLVSFHRCLTEQQQFAADIGRFRELHEKYREDPT